MNKENQEPAGSVPANPIADNTPEPAKNDNPTPAETPSTAPSPADEKIANLEKMLADSQGMIGKQSTEVGDLRSKLEAMQSAQPKDPEGPSIEDQIDAISDQMEEGDIGLREGNKQIAILSAKMGEKNAINMIREQQQQDRVTAIQQKFLDENPDFEELRDNGTLQAIVDQDPMADIYSAFIQVKSQKKLDELQSSFEQEKSAIAAKIPEAKEEGAKLAQGAAEAGKVLGKNGSAARAAASAPKPFANRQDAENAMMATLHNMRSQ